MGKPPADMSGAWVFQELCGSKLPYLGEGAGPVPYERDKVTLPSGRSMPLSTPEHLSTSQRERLEGETVALLTSSLAAEQALHDAGIAQPYADPAFKSSVIYGQLIRDHLELGLVELVSLRRAYLDAFLSVHKKDGRMRLIIS